MNKQDLYYIICKPKDLSTPCELDLKNLWVRRDYKAIEALTGVDVTSRCIRCFKPLNQPLSVKYHMGPVCRKKFKKDYWSFRQTTIDWNKAAEAIGEAQKRREEIFFPSNKH